MMINEDLEMMINVAATNIHMLFERNICFHI